MDLPERRKCQARKNVCRNEDDGPAAYLHCSDGTWWFVGPDGWPVDSEDYLTEMDKVECAPVDAELLAAVLAALSTIDVEPISVRDSEIQ